MNPQPKINLILADDSSDFNEAVSFFLSRYPALNILDVCENGQELLESEHLSQADVILLDIRMPIMDGLEATRAIKKDRPNLKVIGITMDEDELLLKETEEAGFDGLIYKVNVVRHLLDEVERVFADIPGKDPISTRILN